MMMQLDWEATINSIRDQLPQAQFQNWLKPITLLRQDDSSIVLGVPNQFHEEWVKSKYSDRLSKAIHEQCGTQLELAFEITADEQAKPTLDPELTPGEPLLDSARPSLRLVEGAANPDLNLFEEQQARQPPPRPSLPTFTTPYWEFNFNLVPSQCAKLITNDGELPMNPLVIQGGVGMGKTHLLAQIGNAFYAKNNFLRIKVTNAEAFTTEMVFGFKNNNIESFRRKFRIETDILLFDDVQTLACKKRTQEELVHVFNDIINRGGRVIFTSNTPLHDLQDFIEPLRSRLLSGVIAEIKPPTYEEKVALLKKTAEHNGIPADETVLRSLASKGQKDIRELVSSIIRLHLEAKLENRPLDIDFISQKGWARQDTKENVTMGEIIALVEHTFGVSRTDLMSKSRKSVITWARQVAMYLARHYTLLPLQQIGKLFGRDHATVIHAFSKVKETMDSQPTRRFEIEFLMKKLASRTGRDANVEPF